MRQKQGDAVQPGVGLCSLWSGVKVVMKLNLLSVLERATSVAVSMGWQNHLRQGSFELMLHVEMDSTRGENSSCWGTLHWLGCSCGSCSPADPDQPAPSSEHLQLTPLAPMSLTAFSRGLLRPVREMSLGNEKNVDVGPSPGSCFHNSPP